MTAFSEQDLIYAAATIDCEGWVGIYQGVGYDRKRNAYKRYGCTARVGTTSKVLADWLHKTFGGGVYFRTSQSPKWKDQYHWVLGSKNLKVFLIHILPFLKLKQKQVELALEYLENFQTNNPTWRQEMKEKMNDLNRKGKPVTTTTPDASSPEVKIESELYSDVQSAAEMTAPA